jgi:hypothetical protein
VNKFHEMIGHCSVGRLKKTANIHGLKLKGEFKVCEDCAVAKARQRNINEDWKGGSQVPGERVYLDISSIKGESYGGSCFWALVVDDHRGYCWSLFLKGKSDLKGKFLTLLTDLKLLAWMSSLFDAMTREKTRLCLMNVDLKNTM